jgi:hypothetical protein
MACVNVYELRTLNETYLNYKIICEIDDCADKDTS